MILKSIRTPDQLRTVISYLAERIEVSWKRETVDHYLVTITYRNKSLWYETTCLENGFPEPNAYAAVSWLHTYCQIGELSEEEYGKRWRLSGDELHWRYSELQRIRKEAIEMFGAGFITSHDRYSR